MTGLPAALLPRVRAVLEELEPSPEIVTARGVGGGCINHATRLETRSAVFCLKWNPAPLAGMFRAEAEGLALLAETNTVRVPTVFGHGEAEEDSPGFILLEWLQGSAPGDPARLGEQLTALHRAPPRLKNPPAYGLGEDNYLGSTLQVNGWETSWPRFFATYRLKPQMELARRNGHLTPGRESKLTRLIERIDQHLDGYETRPSLIHGDLWAGNVIAGPGGLALIDPAVSYSDREAEIAYTQLFGGFSPHFYQGYQSAWPLEPGFEDRQELHNLYHLLNHLNLFGESYGSAVDRILRRYAA